MLPYYVHSHYGGGGVRLGNGEVIDQITVKQVCELDLVNYNTHILVRCS